MGTLDILPISDHLELLSDVVAQFVEKMEEKEGLGVALINESLSDTAEFCKAYDVPLNRTVNCVVLQAKRGEREWYCACAILGNTRADINGLARRTLSARRVSFAPMGMAVAKSQMEYGAITPIGLPEDWTILIDRAIADADSVIVGSGLRKSKIIIPGNVLAKLPNVIVLDGLGREKGEGSNC